MKRKDTTTRMFEKRAGQEWERYDITLFLS
jgi:hypothetical protein